MLLTFPVLQIDRTQLATMLTYKTMLSVTQMAPDWIQLNQQEPVYIIRYV